MLSLGLGLGINKFSGFLGNVIKNFTIDKSFLLDGVDENFTVNSGLDTTIMSGSNSWSISVMMKYTGFINLFGDGDSATASDPTTKSFAILINGGGVQVYYNTFSGICATSGGVISTSGWSFITFNYDKSLSSNRGQIFVNGSQINVPTNTLPATELDSTGVYKFFSQFNSAALFDRVLTLAEHQDYYNNGEPKDPQALFGSSCKLFLNPDNSGNTAPFTITDSVNGLSATSVNMEDSDKTTDSPYS